MSHACAAACAADSEPVDNAVVQIATNGASKVQVGVNVAWFGPPKRFFAKEPDEETVKLVAAGRKGLDQEQLVNHTMFLAQSSPHLLWKVREYEERMRVLQRKRDFSRQTYKKRKADQ